MAHLAAKGVCLDVCPTSNYLLRVVEDRRAPDLGELLGRLFATTHGVAVSIILMLHAACSFRLHRKFWDTSTPCSQNPVSRPVKLRFSFGWFKSLEVNM